MSQSQMSTPAASSKKTPAKVAVKSEVKMKVEKVDKTAVAKSGVGANTGAAVPAKTRSKSGGARPSAAVAADRHSMIATAAYYRAQQRGFIGGDHVADWLASEAEIDAMKPA